MFSNRTNKGISNCFYYVLHMPFPTMIVRYIKGNILKITLNSLTIFKYQLIGISVIKSFNSTFSHKNNSKYTEDQNIFKSMEHLMSSKNSFFLNIFIKTLWIRKYLIFIKISWDTKFKINLNVISNTVPTKSQSWTSQ